MATRTMVLGMLGAVVILGAWMLRYDIETPAAGGRGVFKMDRWTGTVEACYATCVEVDR